MTARALPVAALCLLGAGWGATQPLVKIAVSGEFRAFGLIVWQLLIAVLLLGTLSALRGRPLRPPRGAFGLLAMIAVLGTLLPNAAGYTAARFLPSGVMSIVIASVPMLAFPMALALRQDRFSAARLAGLALGLGGVALIALPGESLPDPAMTAFLPLALIAPACYALEGNLVALRGTGGLDPLQVLFGASVLGLAIALPVALATGQWIPPAALWEGGAAGRAVLAAGVIHAVVYTGYVWLIGAAGAVFAAQIAYLVTGSGVFWAMVMLGERYSLWVWAALGLMLAGLALVQPRPGAAARAPAAAAPG